MTKYLIKKLREGLANGRQKEILKKLNTIYEEHALANELIMVNGRFNKIESDNRKGILSYDEYMLHTARVSDAILGIIDQIEQDKELLAALRNNEKQALFADYIKLTVDFSAFKAGLVKDYRGGDFINIDDFLNELYFEISDFVAPGSFRREWVLKKKSYDDQLMDVNDRTISALLNETYSLGERMYTHEEMKEIYEYSDATLVVCRL